jgi:hypothetical protein
VTIFDKVAITPADADPTFVEAQEYAGLLSQRYATLDADVAGELAAEQHDASSPAAMRRRYKESGEIGLPEQPRSESLAHAIRERRAVHRARPEAEREERLARNAAARKAAEAIGPEYGAAIRELFRPLAELGRLIAGLKRFRDRWVAAGYDDVTGGLYAPSLPGVLDDLDPADPHSQVCRMARELIEADILKPGDPLLESVDHDGKRAERARRLAAAGRRSA